MSETPSKSEDGFMAHTAGPWRTQGWVPTWAYIPVKDARHNVVCTMYPDNGHGYTREECEANARLIAAAPDLLAALKAVTDLLEGFRENPIDDDLDEDEAPIIAPALDAARAAIAKAEGETP